MLALAFRAGATRFALRAQLVVEVLPRIVLRPVTLAPAGVVGLLPFRGTLTPVVDLCLLVLGRESEPFHSTRIVVLKLGAGADARLLGLIAEDVLELLPIGATVPGLRLTEHPWLTEHLADQPDAPQMLEPDALLPEALAALFVAEAPA